jgi:hypothetical protein
MLRRDLKINLNNMPVGARKIHFIRIVDSKEDVIVLNERFHVSEEYIGEYVWATIDTKEQSLVIVYNDEEMVVHKIRRFDNGINEKVVDPEKCIFVEIDSEKVPIC